MDTVQVIENHLQNAIKVQGRPEERFNLLEQMDRMHIPGVSVAVIENGEIAWAKGYGVLEAGRSDPVTTKTRFQAASISKPVTAISAMQLVERGKVSLDEDVNGKLQSWKVPENAYMQEQKVTLRRLLSHSAGLTVHGFEGYAAGNAIPTIWQVLDGLPPANSEPVRVDVIPGSMTRYSGGGTTVAQLLISELYQRPFRDVMREEVLERAEMTNSGYDQPLPVEWVGSAAVGHRAEGTVLPGKWHTYPELAAAGLWTTPEDLSRFAIALRDARRGKKRQFLRQATARQVLTRQSDEFGIGVALQGEGDTLLFRHGGANEGFRCDFFMIAESGMGAAVMTNSDVGNVLVAQIMRSICSIYELPAYPVIEKPCLKLENEYLRSLAGVYESSEIMGIKGCLKVERDMLVFSIPGFWERLELLPESSEHFYDVQNGFELSFGRDAEGVYADFLIYPSNYKLRRVSDEADTEID